MKVKFFLDSGANIHSCRSETFDTAEDFLLEEGEWEELSEEEQYGYVTDWANETMSIWFEELD